MTTTASADVVGKVFATKYSSYEPPRMWVTSGSDGPEYPTPEGAAERVSD
jgi:hypothetical protein